MSDKVNRREFLGAVGAAAAGAVTVGSAATGADAASAVQGPPAGGASGRGSRIALQPFDYQGVSLRPSRWQKQYQSARDYYLNVPDDDILHGFRREAGLPAPGHVLGGWCSPTSATVFGQWLQAMSRTSRANDDVEMRKKAVKLVDEWAKTLGADGDARMRHYPWEKLVGGLSDAHQYIGHDKAPALMARIVDWGIGKLDRRRTPAANTPWELHSGTPLEWYTLSENLYRAARLTGLAKYREFGDVWRYDAYWNRFAGTSRPTGAQGVHAYSHCNSFSGAAAAYGLDGDARLLQITKNFYDFLQGTQCYATGGYGPAERYVYDDGALGASLETRVDSFEAPCCTWAAFKLAKYLMTFTGESRYGDWMERLLYNAIGAALPIVENGKHFYYADYHLGAGLKYYSRNTYTCCSGTYFQDVVEYQDLIYFHDDRALAVNLFLPSSVEWKPAGRTVKVVQETAYPEAESIDLRIEADQPVRFALRLRVPAWSAGVGINVNGTAVDVPARPGAWASIDREWRGGDRVTMTIPLRFRRVPIDRWHPDRIAVVRGPVVYAQQIPHKNVVRIPPDDAALNDWLVATDSPTVFRFKGQIEASQRDDFQPLYQFEELERYRLYHDPSMRTDLW
jgi:uncharacterized protein